MGLSNWAFECLVSEGYVLNHLFIVLGLRFFNLNVLFWVCQIELLMFGFRILGFELQIHSSCGFEIGFFNSNCSFWFCQIELLMFGSEFWNLNYKLLVLAVLGLGFSIRMVHFEFVKLTFWCKVSIFWVSFWVLNYKFLVLAVLGLGFSIQMVDFEFVKLNF